MSKTPDLSAKPPRGLTAALVLAVTLLAAPCMALAGEWTITKLDYTPEALDHLKSVQNKAKSSKDLMETSNERPVRKYREFLDALAARKVSTMDQLKAVNTYVDNSIRQRPDMELDGDIWAPPYETLMKGGDCEDVAIVKYWGLKRLGFDPKDMFLVMGMTLFTKPPEGHALLAVRMPDRSIQVMYSLSTKVEDARTLKYFEPAYALNEAGFWRVDEPGQPSVDYWQAAFARAMKKEGIH